MINALKRDLVTRTLSPWGLMIRKTASAFSTACSSYLVSFSPRPDRDTKTVSFQMTEKHHTSICSCQNSQNYTLKRVNFIVWRVYLKLNRNKWSDILVIAPWYLNQAKGHIYQKGLPFIVNFLSFSFSSPLFSLPTPIPPPTHTHTHILSHTHFLMIIFYG